MFAGSLLFSGTTLAQYPSLKSTQHIKVDGYKPYIYVNPFSMRSSGGNTNVPNRSTGTNRTYQGGTRRTVSSAPGMTDRELEELQRKNVAKTAAMKVFVQYAWDAMMDGDVATITKYMDSVAGVKNVNTRNYMIDGLEFIWGVESTEKINWDIEKHLQAYNLYIRPRSKVSIYSTALPVPPWDRSLHVRFDSTKYEHKYKYPEEMHLLADLMMVRVLARHAWNLHSESAIQLMEEAMTWYDGKGLDWRRYDELRGLNYYLCGRKALGAKLMVTAMQKFPERKEAIIKRLARELVLTGKDTLADEMYDKIKRGDISGFDDNEPSYISEFAFLTSFVDRGRPDKGLELCRAIEAEYFSSGNYSDSMFHKKFPAYFFEARLFLAGVLNDDEAIRNFYNRRRSVAIKDRVESIESGKRVVAYAEYAAREEYKDRPDKLNALLKELDSTSKKARIRPYADFLYELPVQALLELKRCDLLRELLKPDLLLFESFRFQELDYEAGYKTPPSQEIVALLERISQCGIIFKFAD